VNEDENQEFDLFGSSLIFCRIRCYGAKVVDLNILFEKPNMGTFVSIKIAIS